MRINNKTTIRTSSAGIILKDKKILLIQRSEIHEHFPKFWGCPGGGVEGRETLEEAVVREVKEEVGLDFIPIELFMKSAWRNLRFNRFLGNWSGEIMPQKSEVMAWGWFFYEEAKKLNLAFDYETIIDNLRLRGLM